MSTAHGQLIDFTPPAPLPGLAAVEQLLKQYADRTHGSPVERMFGQHVHTGGKRFRARLALASGRALGSRGDALCHWAAAVEAMHNATLIHDDVQDGDRVRRGRPTTWAVHGVAHAINAGDFGLMLPFLIIGDMSADAQTRSALSALVARRGIQAAEGQYLALSLLEDRRFTWGDYLECVSGTTGSFFGLPVEGCGLMAGLSPERADRLGRAFSPLGTLFQIQDDVLDAFGVKGREEHGGDIRDGKVSALVVKHLARQPQDSHWLIPILDKPRALTTTEDVARTIAAFRSSGALTDCLTEIDDITRGIAEDSTLAQYASLRAVALKCAHLAQRPIEGIQ